MIAFKCSMCGGGNVQIVNWTRPNTRVLVEGDSFVNDMGYAVAMGMTWCEDCEECTYLDQGNEGDKPWNTDATLTDAR